MKKITLLLVKSITCLSLLIPNINLHAQVTEEPPTCGGLKTCGPELVVNGDFEQGNTGFSSDFTLTDRPCCCKTYAIEPDAGAFHPNNWFTRRDVTSTKNTSVEGLFFIGDAQCEIGSLRPWYQTIQVQAGATYAFSAFVSNLDNQFYQNKAVFNIRANGVLLFTESFIINSQGTADTPERWTKICGTYLSTITGTIEISINVSPSINTQDPGLAGADFGIDDISFKAVSPGDPSFTITQAETMCKNEVINFTPAMLAVNHNWNFGSSAATPPSSVFATPSTTYGQAGSFTVTHTISSPIAACTETFSQTISIKNCSQIQECAASSAACSDNLIPGGNFENFTAASPGFTSEFPFNNGTVAVNNCAARYLVQTNSTTLLDDGVRKWKTAQDHTADPGNKFLIADPSCENLDGAKVWIKLIQVTQGVSYNFSAWVSNLIATNNNPVITLKTRFAGAEVLVTEPRAISYTDTEADKWVKLCGVYTAPVSELVEFIIEVAPSNDGENEADFGIDDIELYRIGTANPAFTVLPEDSCALKSLQFTALETDPAWQHEWNFGDGNTAMATNPNHTYASEGTYTISHRVFNPTTGCSGIFELTLRIVDCELGCSVVSNFDIVSSRTTTLPSSMIIEFIANPTLNASTFVNGNSYSWTTNGLPPTVQAEQTSFTYNRLPNGNNLALVQLCVNAYTQDVNGTPVTECSNCTCKVFDVSGAEPAYLRPCSDTEIRDVLGLQTIVISVNPNPATEIANILVDVKKYTNVKIEVLDASGKFLEEIINTSLAIGVHEIKWTPKNRQAQGQYIIKAMADGVITTTQFYVK